MRIGLNATCFNERPSGAKQRFLGLYTPVINAMVDTEFVIYAAAGVDLHSCFEGLENVSIRQTAIRNEGRWGRLINGLNYWPQALSRDHLDIFEGFHLPVVVNPTGQTLLTIHDIRGLNPHTKYFERQIYSAVLNHSISRANTIITVSDSMKRELNSIFPDASVLRIYNGIDIKMFDEIGKERAMLYVRENGIPNDFLLAIGHFEERKNYSRLIDAIGLLNDRGFSIPLVIAGNDSGQYKELQHKVDKLGLQSQIKLLQNLNDNEIGLLYKACRLFIFPSSYEGFGIPLIEAMAAKKAFLSSNISVFRELSENEGYYFPFDDIEAMAEGIEMLSGSDDEQQRLISYGQRRVPDFSFEILSKELISLYRDKIYEKK
jgi:glycosyltransferase involved in cell wall biosynthesis